MKMQRVIRGAVSVFAICGALVFVTGSTASALPARQAAAAKASATRSLQHIQFAATGFPTFYQDNITSPPQIGQGFTLDESIQNTSSVVIGSSHITCKIVAFTTTSLKFACKGTFTFTNGGTLKVVTKFTFNPASLPAIYDAYIVGGTGAYAGAFGVIHVTDPGPGNPTGYVFDFYKP